MASRHTRRRRQPPTDPVARYKRQKLLQDTERATRSYVLLRNIQRTTLIILLLIVLLLLSGLVLLALQQDGVTVSVSKAREQPNFVQWQPQSRLAELSIQQTEPDETTTIVVDQTTTVDLSHKLIPIQENGMFLFDSEPTIIPFTWEDLTRADKQWCKWLRDGNISYDYLGTDRVLYIAPEICIAAIQVQASGGAPASLILGINNSESVPPSNCGFEGAQQEVCTPSPGVGARGPVQFMPETWCRWKPWGPCDAGQTDNSAVEKIYPAFLGASNFLRSSLNVERMYKAGGERGLEPFIQEFSCRPWYDGCVVWNFHRGQAQSVATIAYQIEAQRQYYYSLMAQNQ